MECLCGGEHTNFRSEASFKYFWYIFYLKLNNILCTLCLIYGECLDILFVTISYLLSPAWDIIPKRIVLVVKSYCFNFLCLTFIYRVQKGSIRSPSFERVCLHEWTRLLWPMQEPVENVLVSSVWRLAYWPV